MCGVVSITQPLQDLVRLFWTWRQTRIRNHADCHFWSNALNFQGSDSQPRTCQAGSCATELNPQLNLLSCWHKWKTVWNRSLIFKTLYIRQWRTVSSPECKWTKWDLERLDYYPDGSAVMGQREPRCNPIEPLTWGDEAVCQGNQSNWSLKDEYWGKSVR